MQIKNYLARILMGGALLTATTTLTLPAMGQTNYPLRLRGSSGITTAYTNGNLFIQFEPGDNPAGNGLQPGQGSWLDRGLRQTEPHVLKQTVSEDEAKTIADYLRSETHFATFYCYNTNHGYFEVVNAETFVSESVSSNDTGAPAGQSPVLNVNGGGDSSGSAGVVFSDNTGGGTGRDHKDRRDDHKDHRDDSKEHREVAKKGHDEGKERHEKEHHEGGGSHGIALVKPHAKPLVKANPKPAPKVTKAPPRPSPKKKA
jgi:hypothetical protein